MKSILLLLNVLLFSCSVSQNKDIEQEKLNTQIHIEDSVQISKLIQMRAIDSSISWNVKMLMKFDELHKLERQRDSIINSSKHIK